MTRFDSLVHVTRDGKWLNQRDDASYRRLVRELDTGEIDRACLVGLPGVVDNEYVLDCARTSGSRLVPIAGFDPSAFVHAATMAADIAAIAAAGFAGIKLHPRLGGYDPLGPACLAAIRAAADTRLVVFLDTMFRQRAHATEYAADTIDRLVHDCAGARIVLLHGGGSALLDVADIVRQHDGLVLDLSFTVMRYAGTSLDADIRWVMGKFDERVVVGSDMPEYTPAATFARAQMLADGMAPGKWANIAYRNLTRLFASQP